jgi:chitodextrinase
MEQLDGCPFAVDHSAQASAVGDLVLSPDNSELYYWYQYGWSPGLVATSVRRIDTNDWLQKDATNINYPAWGKRARPPAMLFG